MQTFEAKLGKINSTTRSISRQVLASCLRTTIEMLRDRQHEHIQACQNVDELVSSVEEGRVVAPSRSPRQGVGGLGRACRGSARAAGRGRGNGLELR